MTLTTNTPTPVRTAPDVRLPADDHRGRLVRTVFASARLMAVLPPEFDTLTTALTAAIKAAAEARQTPVPADDLAAEVDATLRAGGSVDVADLISKLGVAETARAHRNAAVKLLAEAPARYRDELVQVIVDSSDALYDALAEDLDTVLNDAEEIAAKLGGVTSAEEAVDNGLADEFAALRRLARRHDEVRKDHRDLLNAANDLYRREGGRVLLARTMYAGIGSAWPRYAEELRGHATADLTGRVVSSAPFDPFGSSTDDLLLVVRHRATLSPRIGRPGDEADGAVVIRDTSVHLVRNPRTGELEPVRPEPGSLQAWHGSEANVLAHQLPGGSPAGLRDYSAAQQG
ncbi:hypothetical protein O2W15_02090 [Modestobacter sp. VKM Ac-2979]|uniref:hypothetical protein n=1 Tax=unclassified Modestobacter TaxID=2643866 RepID=UPI0022AB7A61|nr:MULTISPECIES: hypothetical protein [unclassified Modestobacter]MCZ2810216.1 hypothetical protein [Modestobacter sp. VKM Ac-2979]MCZ2841702.1 hypothetical protein [Modestobacter sp. VKM Ac-2980]